MNERIIELKEIAPNEFFGPQNKHLNLIKRLFPKLKIVARDNIIKTYGEGSLMDDFERRMNLLQKYFNRFNQLDTNVIEQIMTTGADQSSPNGRSDEVLVHGVSGRLIRAKSENQKRMVELMKENDMLFAIGPAGTGKTYTAVALAVKALKEKQVRRIVLTRPAVESGENLGFLPGDLKDKLDPYMQPLYDALRDMIPYDKLQGLLEAGTIQIAPLAFMRGRTLDSAFVILDEAQNTTRSQMKMFLTRMGKHAKFIITGDPGQIDLPRKQVSGLKEALKALQSLKGIGVVSMNEKDVIRHRLVKGIIDAYNTLEKKD